MLETTKELQELLNNQETRELLSEKTRKEFLKTGTKLTPKQQEIKTKITKLLKDLNDINIQVSYKYNPEELAEELKPLARALAENAVKVQLSKSAFTKSLEFIKAGKLKTEDKMPYINFDFEINGKQYHFNKLLSQDMRGFMLGKLSNCCQSVGDHSEKCVLDGMSKANAGFYVITDEKGKIHAQSYAWLAGEEQKATSLVLDSFEFLGKEDAKLFSPAMKQLGLNKVNIFLLI